MLQIPKFKPLFTTPEIITTKANPLKERCFNDFGLFVREYFPHHFWGEFSQMHQDFIQMEERPDRRGVKEAIAAPRGNAKTTFKALIKPIHAICYGYERFILIVGWSSGEATDKVKDIRDELLVNERLIEDFGSLLGKTAGKSDFITRNNIRVTARGRGGQIRGLKHRQSRPSLVIMDDIESLESVNTPEQRQKTTEFVMKDVIGAGAPDGSTNFVLVGTVLQGESFLVQALNKPGWYRKKYRAVINETSREDLWKAWEEIYCDLLNPNAQEEAEAFYIENQAAMMEGVEVLWPEGEPYYKLREFILQNGRAAFNSEKQNEPFDPERQLLNPDACKNFKVLRPVDSDWPEDYKNPPKDAFIIRVEGEKDRYSRELTIIQFHDPALAEEKKSDYGAIVTCAQDEYGYIYVLDAWLKKQATSKQVEASLDQYVIWSASRLYLETNGFQRLMKPHYDDEAKARDLHVKIIGITQSANKVHRIGTLEPYFSNRWIRLNVTLDPNFIEQIRLFPTTHDDGPDALQGCVERLKRPGGYIRQTAEGDELS